MNSGKYGVHVAAGLEPVARARWMSSQMGTVRPITMQALEGE